MGKKINRFAVLFTNTTIQWHTFKCVYIHTQKYPISNPVLKNKGRIVNVTTD